MTDARIAIASEALMREADRLSGASPKLGSVELQALFAPLTRDKLLARARMLALGQTRDSEERAKLGEAVTLQAAENEAVRRLLNREFPKTVPYDASTIRGGSAWIYAATLGGLVKLGSSARLEDRLRRLREQHGPGVDLLHTVEVRHAYWTERRLHAAFRAQRVKGEWF